MSTLDGNAIAGMLHVAFGREMTTALGTCGGCGRQSRLGQAAVYRGAGTVVRCPYCEHAWLVIIEKGDMMGVSAEGLAALEFAN
jgi:DNA-directed RNA polymerase subunit RPC12/RpoP